MLSHGYAVRKCCLYVVDGRQRSGQYEGSGGVYQFFRGMFKGTEPTKYIQLAYLTGILPIKKEKTQSALNNFKGYSMLNSGPIAPDVGFTEAEVHELCSNMSRALKRLKEGMMAISSESTTYIIRMRLST